MATVDLLMFLSSPLWQEGMLDSWLLPHNITVLYAFACPHCSWFHCVGDLTKKDGKKWQRKVESYPVITWVVITSPAPITAEFLISVAKSQDAYGYVKIQPLIDISAICTFLLTVHLCSNPTFLHSFLTSRWYIFLTLKTSPQLTILHRQFSVECWPTFPLSALTLQTPNPVV